jgi:hypothetical protein
MTVARFRLSYWERRLCLRSLGPDPYSARLFQLITQIPFQFIGKFDQLRKETMDKPSSFHGP